MQRESLRVDDVLEGLKLSLRLTLVLRIPLPRFTLENNVSKVKPKAVAAQPGSDGSMSSSIVVATRSKQEKTALAADGIGCDIVRVYIGKKGPTTGKLFTVHKKLICAASSTFKEAFSAKLASNNKVVIFAKEVPAVFKLFLEYLYLKHVPYVKPHDIPTTQAARLHLICQLYAYGAKFKIAPEFENKVMDAIQDGFRVLQHFPEAPMIKNIFDNTPAGCHLQKFCGAASLFNLRSAQYQATPDLSTALTDNRAFLDEFLDKVRSFTEGNPDPRVRNCNGDEECLACRDHDGFCGNMTNAEGVWPCAFHHVSFENEKLVNNFDNGPEPKRAHGNINESQLHMVVKKAKVDQGAVAQAGFHAVDTCPASAPTSISLNWG
ncbi:hypothetical protein B7494_g7726 [Chlorociboria aeruginascens]|nr:hypothetical protein B7494_g7726 [Chlorociboria aeruginascens]